MNLVNIPISMKAEKSKRTQNEQRQTLDNEHFIVWVWQFLKHEQKGCSPNAKYCKLCGREMFTRSVAQYNFLNTNKSHHEETSGSPETEMANLIMTV